MKIIQFLHDNELGGMEKFCIDLSNALSKEHQVLFLGDRVFKKYLDSNVIFVELDLGKSRNNIRFLYKLFKVFEDFSPDIIHVHKQKSIQIMNRLKAFLDTPFVATKHDLQIKKAFYGLRYAITLTKEMESTVKADNLYKIYNGIPYNKAKKIEMPVGFNIVAVGGLREVKGFEGLIESVSHLTFPFHLTIIGEGVLRKTLFKQIRDLGIEDKVSLLGFKSNVNDYLHSSDLQVISSKSEGFSLAMVEGIFFSKRLISTKVGISNELLPDSCLYDVEDLTEKINDVHENQERYLQAFSKVEETYKELLTIETCVNKHLNVYEKIIENYRIDK
jgi:glycosyltransferase involved in cell wall biosynthesis